MPTGSTLEAIVQALDAKICSISPASGFTTSVSNVSGQTVVTPSTIGSNTNYQVGIANNILNNITNNTNNIVSINNFLTDTVTNITSSSLTITTPSPHTFNIEAPAGNTNLSGVTYADYVVHDSFVNSLMINNTQNFVTKSNVNVGDIIKYRILGQITSFPSPNNTEFTLTINNGSTVLDTQTSSITGGSAIKTAFITELTFFVTGATTAILNCITTITYYTQLGVNPIASNLISVGNNASVLGANISNIDFTALNVKIAQTVSNGGYAAPGYNTINCFTSEIIKKY
jgi:hypothetical protein